MGAKWEFHVVVEWKGSGGGTIYEMKVNERDFVTVGRICTIVEDGGLLSLMWPCLIYIYIYIIGLVCC